MIGRAMHGGRIKRGTKTLTPPLSQRERGFVSQTVLPWRTPFGVLCGPRGGQVDAVAFEVRQQVFRIGEDFSA